MKSNLKLFSVLFSAAFLMLLTGCKDNPTDVAKKWHSAAFKGDLGKAMQYTSGATMEKRTKELVEAVKAQKSISYSDPKIDGDTATVRVTTKENDVRSTREFKLAKVDGKWKIISVKPVME